MDKYRYFYWKQIDEALRLVEKATDAKEFQDWIEKDKDGLNRAYGEYKSSCCNYGEADSFSMWALERFLKEKLK